MSSDAATTASSSARLRFAGLLLLLSSHTSSHTHTPLLQGHLPTHPEGKCSQVILDMRDVGVYVWDPLPAGGRGAAAAAGLSLLQSTGSAEIVDHHKVHVSIAQEAEGSWCRSSFVHCILFVV